MTAFALDLDHRGIRLLRQTEADWEELDCIPIDAADLAARMREMQATAARLADGLLETVLIIPPSQIIYRLIPPPGDVPEAEHVAACFEGLTPCPVEEMVFDWRRVPGGLAVAALDVNTLDEAESFTVPYGFNPVRFVAMPDDEIFPDVVDFGPTQFVRYESETPFSTTRGEDETPEPVLEPVPEPAPHLVPVFHHTDPDAEADPEPEQALEPEVEVEPETELEPVAAVPDPEEDPDPATAVDPVSETEDAPELETVAEPVAEVEDDPEPEPAVEPAEETEDEPELAAEIEDKPELAAEREEEPELAAESEDEPEPAAEPEEEPEPTAETEEEPEPESVFEPALETEDETEAPLPVEPALEAEPDPEPEPGFEPAAELEEDPELEPEPEPLHEPAFALDAADEEPAANLFADDPADPEPDCHAQPDPDPEPQAATPPPALTAPRRVAPPVAADPRTIDWRRIGVTSAIAASVMAALVAVAAYLVRPDETALPVITGPDGTTITLERAPRFAQTAPVRDTFPEPATEIALFLPSGDGPVASTPPRLAAAPLSGPETPRAADGAVVPAALAGTPARLWADPLTPPVPDAAAPVALPRMEARANTALDGPGTLEEDRSVLPPGWLRSADFWQTPPPPPPDPVGETLDQLYLAAIDPAVLADDAFALPEFPPSEAVPTIAALPPEPGQTFDLDTDGLVVATPDGAETPDGVIVTEGRPDLVPPRRPLVAMASIDPAQVAAVAGQTPRARPQGLVERYERAQFGGRTRAEMASLVPLNRPASDQEIALETASTAPSAFAIPSSQLPQVRPEGFAERLLARRQELERQAEEERRASAPAIDTSAAVAAAVDGAETEPEPEAPASAQPSIPTSASVARQATITGAINLRRVNLIGVYGSSSDRRALVRLPSGRYVKVEVGDRIDGGRVAAIGDGELRYVKGGRNVTLKVPSG